MKKPAGRFSIILFVLAVCLLTRPGVRGQEAGTLRLHFMEVGQGDGAVLISPRGEVVLFDGGTPAECGKALGYMQSLGLTHIDYHVATSYKRDHIGCAADALKMLPLTRMAIDQGGFAETREFAQYAAAAADKRRAARPGQRITLDADAGRPVTIDLIRVGTTGLAADDEPAAGLVAVIRYGEFAAELGGDLSGAVERAIAERVGHVDVYGVHNHGSPDSATADWLSIVQPQVGIVSVSPGNPDGAPSLDAMARLHAAGVTTYWTSIGNGVSPEPGRDSVVGNIVVEVAADAARFSVRGDAMPDASGFASGRVGGAPGSKTSVPARVALASATSPQAVTAVQELTITTFAGGTGTYGYADGSRALFKLPQAAAVDASGTVFVADTANHTIRKISSDGNVTTFAGAAGQRGSTDGNGSAARFDQPIGIAVDATGTVYVADYGNSTIRRINPSGVVTTLAGSPGLTGSADGLGGAARFTQPGDVAVDSSGNIYVADTGNQTIRQIAPGAVVSTVAGSPGQAGTADGAPSAARFSSPGGIAVDSARAIYVSDFASNTIRKIAGGSVSTLAGTAGTAGSTDGTGAAARFRGPSKLGVDSAGNVYVADQMNHTIRKITPAAVVTVLAGSPGLTGAADGVGGAARFYQPISAAVDAAGNIIVAEYANNTIRKIVASDGTVATVAGLAGKAGSTDGSGTGGGAKFRYPSAITVDAASNLYVADQYNAVIRKITPEGVVSTLAGAATQFGSADGVGGDARFNYPFGITVDAAGVLYVSDTNNHTIRRIMPDGMVTTLAGFPGQAGADDGTGGGARFRFPHGIAVDGAGTLYVADRNNHRIRRITTNGLVSTLAGSGTAGFVNGTGTAAAFSSPEGLALAPDGTLYVSDTNNCAIRRIVGGVVTTVAGGGCTFGGPVDGTGSAARFSSPSGIALDLRGDLYVGDRYHYRIRKVTPAGVVTTVAGSNYGFQDGTGAAARFTYPQGIAVAPDSSVYITDQYNNAIRKGVRSAPWSEFPFGVFDTPPDVSTGAGEVAVTGWAMDDEGVAAVEIYRSPKEGTGSPTDLIYIGNALFVNGARGDIAAAYPNLPNKDRAGWGYMLLTNYVGEGTFTISAFAKDTEGQSTLLGRKKLTINNAASVKPFGTIDTPMQGETVSGTIVNFGWALTPQPNTIPKDGSTISVYVDGVFRGHPVYNNYRVDVATLFPGLNNSNGAVGYFMLDTRTLSNGVHTIEWVARDNAGNAQGMGSRYFTVKN